MIEIRDIYGKVIFLSEVETVKDAVEIAVANGANLAGANLAWANLYGAKLDGAKLDGANLDGANLDGANLDGANLAWANLYGANLDGANLYGAKLDGANLAGAKLGGANLAGAKLAGANLAWANLYGANLDGANLDGATGINPLQCTPLLMMLDQPGPIRAYKLVTAEGRGPTYGSIRYEVGGSYSVENANTDPTAHCAAGINLATLDWCMRDWIPGHRILVAEFTAADIAAIPTGTDGKFRVHRCKIVAEKDLVQIGLVEAKKDEVSK